MTAHTMAINKDVFEAADAMQYIDEETRTWTTEDFKKAVQAVYDSGQENVGAVYCAGQGGDQGTRALVNNLYVGTFTNPEHTEYTANSEENIKALELLSGMDGINFDASLQGADEINLFCNGTLAMAFCWNVAQEKKILKTSHLMFFQWHSLQKAASLSSAAVSGDSVSLITAMRPRSKIPKPL